MAKRAIHFAETAAGRGEGSVVYPRMWSYALADGITARPLEDGAGVVASLIKSATEFAVITPLAGDAGACSHRVVTS